MASRASESLTREFSTRNVEFDLRLVKGAFKGAVRAVERPVLVAHIALFTEVATWSVLPC